MGGKVSEKIGIGEKFSYLLANIGNIPLMTLLGTFFLIFYTDVVGLDPGKLATLFLISKVIDGVSDPIMGFILDKFKVTKMGKFRPMLIIGTIICSINYALLWFGAVWSPVGKYAIVYVTYILLGWTFDIMDISLNSLLPVMTPDNKERNTLSLIKSVGYIGGAMVLNIVGPIIVASATLESYYLLIFGSLAVVVVFSIVGALGVHERVTFEDSEDEKYGLKELFKFLTCRPVAIAFLAGFLSLLGQQAAGGANTFFFTYLMGDIRLMSAIGGLALVGMVPGMIVSPILANKFGKKWIYVVGLAISAVSNLIRLVAPTSLPLIYVASIGASLGMGFVMPLMYGIQADNTMYVQYTTGKRAEAAIASLSSFITKVGQGVAGAIPGYVLAWTGFISGAETQPQSAITGLIVVVCLLPGLFSLAAAIVFALGYNLNKKDVDDMAIAISKGEHKQNA